MAERKRSGWVIKGVMGLPWLWLIWEHKLYGLIPSTVIASLIAVKGWVEWGRYEQEEQWRRAIAKKRHKGAR